CTAAMIFAGGLKQFTRRSLYDIEGCLAPYADFVRRQCGRIKVKSFSRVLGCVAAITFVAVACGDDDQSTVTPGGGGSGGSGGSGGGGSSGAAGMGGANMAG